MVAFNVLAFHDFACHIWPTSAVLDTALCTKNNLRNCSKYYSSNVSVQTSQPLKLILCVFSIGRKREWFKVEDAIKVLQCHKPVHAEYLEKLKLGCSPTNGNSVVSSHPGNSSLYVTSTQTSGLPSTVR